MKKIIYLIIACLSSRVVQAQDDVFRFFVPVGLSVSQGKELKQAYSRGFHFGLAPAVLINEHFSIKPTAKLNFQAHSLTNDVDINLLIAGFGMDLGYYIPFSSSLIDNIFYPEYSCFYGGIGGYSGLASEFVSVSEGDGSTLNLMKGKGFIPELFAGIEIDGIALDFRYSFFRPRLAMSSSAKDLFRDDYDLYDTFLVHEKPFNLDQFTVAVHFNLVRTNE